MLTPTTITTEEAEKYLKTLVGKEVSDIFFGYAYFLILKFGSLVAKEKTSPGGKKYNSEEGDITLTFETHTHFFKDSSLLIDTKTTELERVQLDELVKQQGTLRISEVEYYPQESKTVITFTNGCFIVATAKAMIDELGTVWFLNDHVQKKWLVLDTNGVFSLGDSTG